MQRGKLGVTIQPVDDDLAQTFGLPEPTGALVSSVEPDSAADKAGLQPGDVVLSVNGVTVASSADLPRMIGEKRPGTRIELELWREGVTRNVTATLDEMQPDVVAQAATPPGRGEDTGSRLGLTARALGSGEASRLGVAGGIIVEAVSGPAEAAGVRPGDVVLALNNRQVTSVAEFRRMVENAGARFALLIQRGNSRIFVPVRIE